PENRAGVHLRDEERSAGHGGEGVRRAVFRLQIHEERRAGFASVGDPQLPGGAAREDRSIAERTVDIGAARVRPRSDIPDERRARGGAVADPDFGAVLWVLAGEVDAVAGGEQ